MELGAGSLLHEDNSPGLRTSPGFAHDLIRTRPRGTRTRLRRRVATRYSRFLGTFAADTVDSAWRGRR